MKLINPKGWASPRGYNNGVVAEGKLLFISGQIGWTADQKLVGGGFIPQTEQALVNIIAVVREAGGKPENLMRMTWYVKDKREYMANSKELGTIYQKLFGKHYPAMTLVQVSDLLEEGAVVEIEAVGVIP